MKKRILALAAASVLLLSGSATAQEQGPIPEPVRKAFQQASPTQRLSAARMVKTQYPGLRDGLRSHLQQRYPNLETGTARALLAVGEKHPGLIFSLPRHLIEDLDGEMVDAFLDAGAAVTAKYPNFPARVAELRQQHSPRAAVAQLVAEKYPGAGEDLLRTLRDTRPGLGNSLAIEARTVIRDRYPSLPVDIALEVVGLARERNPELPARILAARRSGERPLKWLMEKDPGFLRAAVERVHQKHGATVRQAAVDILKRLETTHGDAPAAVAGAMLNTVEQRYPDLPRQVCQARRKARQDFREALLAEFPDLPDIVATTVETRHPQLPGKVRKVVDTHYPGLRDEFWLAMEQQLPGVEKEVKNYLTSNHPGLFERLQVILRS